MQSTLVSVSTFLILVFAGAIRGDLAEVLPEVLYDVNGETVSLEALDGKIVGIYFTASWCPPCRQFTPGLVELRNANQENFEVVLVGFDRNPKAHDDYRANYKMEFPAVEFRSEAATKLAERFGVRGIPHLVVLGPDGTVIAENGTAAVRRSAQAALDEWKTHLTR